jgi:outer membrane lipoprotein SlyB
MRIMISPSLIVGLVCALALSACAPLYPNGGSSSPTTYNGQTSAPASSTYSGTGVVQSIDAVQQSYQGIGGTGYGLGTLAGAVVGGIAGSQVGSGTGKTAATVAGTAGGAYIGHQIEKGNQAPTTSYNIRVRMDDGSYQTLNQSSTGGLRVGDRVRIENGSIRRY